MTVALYCPIKPPDHPIPSGDRLIAQNLMAALHLAGREPFLASRFIAYSKRADADILHARKQAALAEAAKIVATMANAPPAAWITYHPYCKAPDWIGPAVTSALGIPYLTVEAAKTGQGFEDGGDLWRDWRAEAQAGMKQADLHLVFKPDDRTMLETLLGSGKKLRDLPPFIDPTIPPLPPIETPSHWRADVPRLVTAGLMRPGKKVENYRLLGEALLPHQAVPWTLTILGDGPARAEIETFFAPFDPGRIHFAGEVSHETVLAHLDKADVFVWPGWKEPIGMVYLEAQACGTPVAALGEWGARLVVAHGETGLLAPDMAAFGDAIATLVSQPSLRADLASKAKTHIRDCHSLTSAALRLDAAINEVA